MAPRGGFTKLSTSWQKRIEVGRDGLARLSLSGRLLSVLRVGAVALGLMGFVLLAAVIVSLDSVLPGERQIALRLGDVVANDIRAPASTTYTSEVLTQARRQVALAGVSPVYDPPDPSVARQQAQLLRQILDDIDTIRLDSFSTLAQKTAYLRSITALTLDTPIIEAILALDEDTWSTIDGEIMLVLERVMREAIRPSDLPVVIDTLPTQVSVRFDVQAAAVVTAVVQDLLRPNRLPNLDATELARQTAVAAVEPETRTFERGQVVVRGGTRIDEADYEALTQLGLLQTPDQRAQIFLRAFLAAALVLLVIGLYISRRQQALLARPGMLVLCAILSLIALLGERLLVTGDLPYIYPMAALALVLVVLVNPEVAIVGMIGQGLLAGLMFSSGFEIAVYFVVGGIVGALMMRATDRVNAYFFAGLSVALANLLVIFVFNVPMPGAAETGRLGTMIVYATLNGLISAMTALVTIFLVTFLFNLTTSLKLVELSQPNQPLLQRLLREAPGTYQHSLQVSNLCEQAAAAIGADAELVRVAALYHDIGKMLNPAFFVENQADGVNPHDVLNDPYRSADIIISHVADGDRLARQYHLPGRIRDFICEHHGTTLAGYFYNQAVAQGDDPEGVDEELFRYTGPKPRSRETAILMLSDASESTVRARKPATKTEVAQIVGQIVEARMRDKQLDDSQLTLNDLESIRVTLIDLLQSVFHPRINYPAVMTRRTASLSAADIGDTGRSRETREIALKEITGEIPRLAPNGGASRTGPVPAAERPSESAEFDRDTDFDDDAPVTDVPPLRRTIPLVPGNGVHSTAVMSAANGARPGTGLTQPPEVIDNVDGAPRRDAPITERPE